MKNKCRIIFFIMFFAASALAANSQTLHFHVDTLNIHDGYYFQRIALKSAKLPKIKILNTIYKEVNGTISSYTINPLTAKLSHALNLKLGIERTLPFLALGVPVYEKDSITGAIKQLIDFNIEITEEPLKKAEAKTTQTYAASSILASGTWFKIAVPASGLYKMDLNFFKSLGVSASSILPANIRVYGNGGQMLSEDNSVNRFDDLVENAIYVSNNNATNFGSNDYVLFYAKGPTQWVKDSSTQSFYHVNNNYSDSSYYFINFDLGAGKRIPDIYATATPNENISSFNDYAVHDLDLINPAKQGREWYGEQFGYNPGQSLSQVFNFNFGSTIDSLICRAQFADVSSSSNNTFSVMLNNNNLINFDFAANIADYPIYESSVLQNSAYNVNSSSVAVTVNYQPGNTNASGYLNFLELNVRRALTLTSQQLTFRDWNGVGPGKIASYQIQNANDSTFVWDITDYTNPQHLSGTNNAGTYYFVQDAGMLHEFVAFKSIALPAPFFSKQIANQNLHGIGTAKLIIVTHPLFLSAAKKLADFHSQKDNISCVVATTEQVYNEFSSGAQDVAAIRDFARMIYKHAGTDTTLLPKYMVLFGGASYDYKNRLPDNSNYVPTYESLESQYDIYSYCSDDFYGFLDDQENIQNANIFNVLDIGIGRMPARDSNGANDMINKIINYKSPASLGAWRLAATFVADNNDGAGYHMQQSDSIAGIVQTINQDLYNENKIFLDATPIISTAGGPRSPDANAAIDNQIFKGTFLINYNGHGNYTVWASERILTIADFNSWQNINKLPFTVTATCDFGQFDHPEFVSAGEQLVLKKDGGVIVALTTTQAVYASSNIYINRQFILSLFGQKKNGITFGDAYRAGKNITYQSSMAQGDLINFRKFALIGDPALIPDFPQYNITTDSVKQIDDAGNELRADTLGALGAYKIYGSVTDTNNLLLNSFNGSVNVTIFDKTRKVKAITDTSMSFRIQDNIIFRGTASVTNGHFSYTFVAPKDINYTFGSGKISTYADNGLTDASASDTSSIKIGGFSKYPVYSTKPPIVLPYIGDSLFVDGGITGANSSLYVILKDETGINVTGTSVGHDLIAVLDDHVADPYVLNDYYETAENTFKTGYVNYPLKNIADGKHSITVRAWDVNDNYGEGTVDFMVINGQIMQIQGLMNYPNPFNDLTHFVFQHNHPSETLDVNITVFNTSGARMCSINKSFLPNGSRSADITWDGTDNNGIKLPTGLYLYRLTISTQNGIQSSGYQKLVLLR